MPVASTEAPILAMLLPSKSAPIIRSRIANRLETTPASRLPCFDSRSMLAREAPVSAVSLAEKNAETSSKAMTMENVSQSMARYSLHLSLEHDPPESRFPLFRITPWFCAPAWSAENGEPAMARHREQSRRDRPPA